MKKWLYYYVVIPLLTAFVSVAQAQDGAFDETVGILTTGINRLIVFLFLVATFIFLWGVVRYISAGGDEDKTADARNMIIWGIIFLAVMVAVWGFVNIVLDFIFNDENTVPIPDAGSGVPQQGGSSGGGSSGGGGGGSGGGGSGSGGGTGGGGSGPPPPPPPP